MKVKLKIMNLRIAYYPYLLLSGMIFLFGFTSCKSHKEIAQTQTPVSNQNLKKPTTDKKYDHKDEKEASVINMTGLDGCTYLIKLFSGERLEPINLPADFKINGLKVLLTYEAYEGASICMAGKMIKITHIKKKDR